MNLPRDRYMQSSIQFIDFHIVAMNSGMKILWDSSSIHEVYFLPQPPECKHRTAFRVS